MLRLYCSAILTATSTLTEPESEKKTVSRPAGVTSTRSCASRAAGSWVSPPNMTWFSTVNCSAIAASSTGWPWPWIAVHQEAIASSTRTWAPSRTTVSQAPWAPTATTGGIASAPIAL